MAMSRKAKIIIGATAAVLITAVIIASVFATRKDTPEVTVVESRNRRELRSNVTASGEVRPIQFMNLTSEVQGRIEEITVKEGDPVTKGRCSCGSTPTSWSRTPTRSLPRFRHRKTNRRFRARKCPPRKINCRSRSKV
jgi:HlyD family secretion protein